VIVDYHVHLRGPTETDEGPLEHTLDAIERYVEAAGRAGVDEVGFTEHLYHFREFGALLSHPYYVARLGHDLDSYCSVVLDAKERGLPVKLGLEVDHLEGREDELAGVLEPYPWDYLLGSVHLLEGEGIWEQEIWARLPPGDVWERYFAALATLARSGLVDVIAHPDYIKARGPRPPAGQLEPLYDEAAQAVAAAGIAAEVSTLGLQTVGELYPAQAFVDAFAARGVPATVASDAHAAQNVGRDFDAARAALRAAGYDTITVFDARAARQEPLG
jgi:histidinol-phosphatase (PHP family)